MKVGDKVYCINNVVCGGIKLKLTINKSYDILKIGYTSGKSIYFYKIMDDDGLIQLHHPEYFITHREYRERLINRLLDNE